MRIPAALQGLAELSGSGAGAGGKLIKYVSTLPLTRLPTLPLPCPPPPAASLPFFGVKPVLVNDKNEVLEGEAEGMLCIAQSWPSNVRTVYGDHERCARWAGGAAPEGRAGRPGEGRSQIFHPYL